MPKSARDAGGDGVKDETRTVLDQIRAHEHGTALWWLGNAGWAVKSDRTLLLIVQS